MRTVNYLMAISLLVAGMGCSSLKEEDIKGQSQVQSGEVFYATLEQNGEEEATKVYADGNLKVLWNADDRISIYNRYTYGYEYVFQGETGQNAGAFAKVVTSEEFVTGNPLDYIYALYPYDKKNAISNTGELSVLWPSVQTYASDSFGIGSNVMVSVTTDNQLRFKNVGGYLAVKLYGENIKVSSITLYGNDGEALSGKAAIVASKDEDPHLSLLAGAQDFIRLECPTPVQIGSTAEDATIFWLVVPPTSFKKGFNITVRTSNGRKFFKSTENSYNIDRNTLCRMAALGISPEDLQFDEEAVISLCGEALASAYSQVQYMVFGNQRTEHNWILNGVGLDTFGMVNSNSEYANWNNLTSGTNTGRHWTDYMYKLVDIANTVVDVIGDNPTNNEVINNLLAEAVFLRSWAFRNLAGLFGQVIYSDNQGAPVLCTREEAWKKLAVDFDYAEQHLPSVPRALGTVTKAAAAHYLAETYLALGQFAEAEAAATRVIGKQDGDYEIMQTRFGNRVNQVADRYGNSLAAPQGAYWDLFRTSVKSNGSLAADANPNDPGNKEAIWVAQIDYQSGDSWWRMKRPVLEAVWAPWVPMGGKNGIRSDKDRKKFYVFTADAVCFPEGVAPEAAGTPAADIAEAQGRKLAYPLSTWLDSIACRCQGVNNAAVGLALLASEYVTRPAGDANPTVWDDPNDFRGSEVMIQRDYYTPSGKKWSEVKANIQARAAAHAAEYVGTTNPYELTAADTINVTPRFWKFSDDRHVFDGRFAYYDTDWYLIRIAETYLLRAEARLAQWNKSGAADDINVLRSRAGAKPCSANEVNIDYILDERVRELFGEEQRRVTLSRLSCNPKATYVVECYPTQDATTSNTLYERTRKYGLGYENDNTAGRRETYTDAMGKIRHIPNIKPYNYILPIPDQLIQKSKEKGIIIQQNDGYTN